MDLDVLVSIVTYNNQAIIKATIEALLEHTQEVSYRIIVYDNNSADKTVETLQALNCAKLEIISSKTNDGFGYGHNKVAEAYLKDCRYFLVLNPDLRIKSNILQELVAFMDANQEIGLLSPKVTFSNGETQYLCKHNPTVFDLFLRRFTPGRLMRKRKEYFEMRYTNYNQPFAIEYATGCFMFFRSKVYGKIEGFDENIFLHLEDADITRRVNQVSQTIFYPYAIVEHIWACGSHKSLRQTFITIKSALYYFQKWGWKLY